MVDTDVTPSTNWAGNLRYSAREIAHPRSLAELQDVIRGGGPLKALGSRHSFNTIADTTGRQVALDAMPGEIVVDTERRIAEVPSWFTYSAVAIELEARGWAVHNMASLPHISIAGAVATSTHGSGDRNGNLSTSVAAIEFVDGRGEVVHRSRGDEDFEGVVVGIGALGVITRVWLDVQPSFQISQLVYEGMDLDTAVENFDAITSSAYSVSIFTDWSRVTQLWLKSTVDQPAPAQLFGAQPSLAQFHPLAEGETRNTTPQGGVPGPWLDRLPHFVMGFTPSNGSELQTEFFFDRARIGEAIAIIRGFADRIQPLLLVTEIRTMTADTLWMSGAYGRETVGVHFTWQQRQPEVEALLLDIEAAIRPLGARPHWGKVFTASGEHIRPLYPRFHDFAALVAKHDPDGIFRNAWLDKLFA